MKRIALFLFVAAALSLAGCSAKDSLSAAEKKAPSLVGKWKGELKMPKSDKEDPMAELGNAFAKMLLGGLTLEFPTEDTFKLTLMGIPLEGKVARTGNKLTLTPETALGMPVEEAKKQNPQLKSEKMEAEISEDGKEITLVDKDAKASGGQMVFKRAEEEKKTIAKSTVTDEEKAIVGSYRAELYGDRPTGLKPEEENELKMAEAMLAGASLDLFEDNTFKMNFMFEMEGTWKVEAGVAKLKMVKVAGMPEGGKQSEENKDMNLRVMSDGKLVSDEKGPSNAKMAFIKK